MATTRAATANAAAAEPGDGTTTPPAPGTPTPTVTHYQQVAAEFMSALDEISQIIPKLEAIHVSTANLVRSRLNVPNEFLATVTAAVPRRLWRCARPPRHPASAYPRRGCSRRTNRKDGFPVTTRGRVARRGPGRTRKLPVC
jgi:hypothetical protein